VRPLFVQEPGLTPEAQASPGDLDAQEEGPAVG